MDILSLIAICIVLFLAVGLAEPLAARLRLPFPVVLAGIGISIGGLAHGAEEFAAHLAVNPETLDIINLPLRSELFLFLFLPILLFQVCLHLPLRRLAEDWVPILTLAILAIFATTFAVGFSISPLSDLPLMACLLLGAIVSTTDPSAVAGMFKMLPAPRRLARIIEGESLLNDAAAIALFSFFLAFVQVGEAEPALWSAVTSVPVLLLGGAAVGSVLALLIIALMTPFSERPAAQISIGFTLPFLANLVAEKGFHVSGITAIVVSAMVFGLVSPRRLPPQTWKTIRETWDLMAHWAGAFIFILAAILVPRFLEGAGLRDVGLVLVIALAALAARGAILFGLQPVLTAARLSPQVSPGYRAVILWGGLRGAVTLALALSVTENPLVPLAIKREIGILAAGFTLFTLLVQGVTLRPFIQYLGLDRLNPLDLALSRQVIAVALQEVRQKVATHVQAHDLPAEIIRKEAKAFGARLQEAVLAAEGSSHILDKERITLGLVSLAGQERELVLCEIRDGVLPARIGESLLLEADRLIERTRLQGRDGYRPSRERHDRLEKWALRAQKYLGLSGPLARLVEDRYEILTARLNVLRQLHDHTDQRVRRIHGKRIAELLEELLRRREEAVQTEIKALRLQFPKCAEAMDIRIIRRTALRLEQQEYALLRQDGLIEEELHFNLNERISSEIRELESVARLDLGMDADILIDRHPAFLGLGAKSRRILRGALKTVSFHPGEVIARRGEPPKSVWFILSGAIEIETAFDTQILGPGDMFGHLAMLARTERRIEARAVGHGTLLRLDEAIFRRILTELPELQKLVSETAKRRGVDLPKVA